MTDDGMYNRGEIIDFSEEDIKRLSSSVIRIKPKLTNDENMSRKTVIGEDKKKPTTRKKPTNTKYTRN